jgi:hypothetical protein
MRPAGQALEEIVTTNGDRLTPPHGLPARELLKSVAEKTTQHDSDIEALRSSAKTIADGVGDLHEWKGEVMTKFAVLEEKVDGLALDVRRTLRPPPMRTEMPSGIDLEAFAERVAAAALEGQARHDSTPEREVEKIVETVTERQKAEAIVKAAKSRSASARRVAEFVVGSLAVAYLLHLIETFHH